MARPAFGWRIFTHNMKYRLRGKYRKVKKPAYEDLMRTTHDLQREEENMLYLRHPYLTVEQSHGHMKEIKTPIDMSVQAFKEKNDKFEKRVTLQDRLCHLRVNEAWD